MARFNRTFAMTTNTPIRLSDGATAAVVGEILPPLLVLRFFVQMAHAGSHLGFVMLGIPNGTTPNPTTDGQLTAELSPATATAPGGSYADPQVQNGSVLGGTVELQKAWIQGSTGDSIIVSWETAAP